MRRLNSSIYVAPTTRLQMIISIILVALVFFFSGLALYSFLTWHFDYWKKRNVPGPKPRVLLGTFPSFIWGNRNFIDDFDDIYNNFKRKYKFVGVFTTRHPQIFILDPQLAHKILTNKFKYFQENESSQWMDHEVEPIAGSNPFVLASADWKIKRAEISPGFTQSRVKNMYPIIQNASQKLKTYLIQQLKSGTNTFDAKDMSLRFTGEVVSDVGWGLEGRCFDIDENSRKTNTFLNMSHRMIAQTFNAFTYYFVIGIFPFLRYLYRVRFFPLETDRFFMQLAQVACKMRKCAGIENGRNDFLQYLLELQQKKHLSDTEMVAHLLTLHFDGFETSATLISHCLLLLARHPEYQSKLRQEIMEHRNQTSADSLNQHILHFEDLIKLPYLQQCIAETLRIFTPLPFMSKVCTEACELENSDGTVLQLQPGDVCLISLQSFHHDEDYFPQAETFMPQRFAAEHDVDSDHFGTKRKQNDIGVYMPFGAGPRICLGMKLALAQAKSAIVEVITNFEVTVHERTRKDNRQGAGGFIVGLEGGIYLQLKQLTHK